MYRESRTSGSKLLGHDGGDEGGRLGLIDVDAVLADVLVDALAAFVDCRRLRGRMQGQGQGQD